VQRALGGDSEGLSALFTRNSVRLYRAAFSVLRSKEDAEDAMQDGLLSAYVNLRSFQGRSRFSTWLTRIVVNAALMNRRKLRAHLQFSLDEPMHGNTGNTIVAQVVDGCPDPEQFFAQVENKSAVDKTMKQLSPLLRSAIHLRDIQHYTTREAAKAEGVKLNVIKSRIFRARRSLAALIEAKDVNL
jgi:RNA polymerase sigma-70 factor (ECF subfamily)